MGRYSEEEIEAVKQAIEAIVRAEMSDAAIDDVQVVAEADEDGDPVLRIRVVYKTARVDPSKAKGLARHLFPAINQARLRDFFPVISFVSKRDNERLSAAA